MMDSEELERLEKAYNERVAIQDAAEPGYAEKWKNFTKHILKYGGDLVVPPLVCEPLVSEPESLKNIFTTDLRMILGEPSNCHQNSAWLLIRGVASLVATGYALSEDGLWRQHSWGLTATGTVLETTQARLAYVGKVLDLISSIKFVFNEDLGYDLVAEMENVLGDNVLL